MSRLIITSTPSQIKITSKKASILINSQRVELKVEREKGSFTIEQRPSKITISNRAFRESILSLKPISSFIEDYAKEGIQAAMTATAAIVEKGNAMANSKTSIGDIMTAKSLESSKCDTVLVPAEKPDISFSKAEIFINFIPDKIKFNAEFPQVTISYVPYSINTEIIRYAKINIDVGK
jgi:hypothetical protein